MTLLAQAHIPHAGSRVAAFVTASVGIAVTKAHPGLSSTDLTQAADQALYLAKTHGRNRIHPAPALLRR